MSPRVPHTQTHEHFDFISIDILSDHGGTLWMNDKCSIIMANLFIITDGYVLRLLRLFQFKLVNANGGISFVQF